MLVLAKVLTAMLALSSYCDSLTHGIHLHRDTSSSSPNYFFTALNSEGITHLVGSGSVDSDYKSVVEPYLSETVTTMSTVWTATDHDNPSSAPLVSITLPEMMTSDDTSQHETLRTESTTDLSHSSEVQTTSTVLTPTRTATISFSTSLVTTPNSSNSLTSPFVTSTTVTTSESPPTTISPTCECDPMDLVLGTLVMGDSWFAVPFNLTSSNNPQCDLENFVGLNVTVIGPSDKDPDAPSIDQFCFSPISCLNGSNNSFSFNSSLCCKDTIEILQCSNYEFFMTPQYSNCSGNSSSFPNVMFTRPGPEATPKNVTVGDTGSDWVLIGWEDFKFCLRQLSYYYMRFVPLYSKGVNNTIYVEVPTTCVNRSFVTGMTDFNSKTCPELFTLESCTNYSVTIEAAIYDNKYLSQPSQSVTFDTIPPADLAAQIDKQVESGSDWLAFQWKLSAPQCQTVTTGFQLNLTNLRNNSYDIYDCNITDQQTLDSKFVFNTSFNDCGERINVMPCSDFEIIVIPQILNSLYDGSDDSALGRTTCEPITAHVVFMDSGSDWISFNWTTSVEDCRKVLTGFWLGIVSTEQRGKQDSLQFISMKDCYCNLREDQAIMFNTSTACQNWDNPGICPCSEYNIYIIPQFFDSLNGTASSFNKTITLPDDGIRPLTQNVAVGGNWISFEWQASTNTCRDAVTGLWISMNRTSVPYFCPLNATDDKFITFNTTSTCFDNQILSPCSLYNFKIQLDIYGKVGQFSKVARWTTPGDDATALINDKKYGVEWISFSWQSSVQKCQRFITGYQLNVTDLFDGKSQFRNLPRTCGDNSSSQSELVFNSSLPCTKLKISPCSNYFVSLAPVFRYFRIDNMAEINGSNAFIEIGTQSGEMGEIKNSSVASQGTNSLTLEWLEPTCRNLSYYNVSVIPDWNLKPGNDYDGEKYLNITPECLEKHPSGNVYLTLTNTTCKSGYKFVSCAPYSIKVLPVYELSSANENLAGWTNNTQTLPFPYEASVNNLRVQEVSTRWISISWPIPTCRVPVSEWILSESGSVISLPPDCPENVNGSHLTLNISDTIVCRNSEVIQNGMSFNPCTNYSLGMNVKYSNLDIQNGSNNFITAVTEIEPPGRVNNVTGEGTNNTILLEWTAPIKNPHCVKGYEVKWNNQTIFTKETHALIEGLEPCSMFPVTVNALSNLSHKLHETPIPFIASTNGVDPAPVVSEINVVRLNNGWTRNVSWLKPEVDYCISGYNVNIKRATSMEIVFNLTVLGKDSTWITLSEEFEQGNLYNILISSFSFFKREMTESNYTTHAFTWDSASNMIDSTAVVCGIIFPILAFAILYAIVLIRKSQGSVLAPEKYFEGVTRSTPSRQTSNRTSNFQRPVIVKELRSTIEWLEADSKNELSMEYESINLVSDKTATCNVAKLPENKEKNRYTNILSYDHSRVKLTTVPPSADYINASFISSYVGHRAYIATQGPLPSTIKDFWLMCFEQNVKMIVALTQLEEHGKIKCAQYWPSTGSCKYGEIRVELTKEMKENDYTIRDFLLTKISINGNVSPAKFVKQMHFTEWPDFGCPRNPEQLINFVHAMRDKSVALYNKYQVTCPIVVHCSAGVGRTGTLIALDILMEQARNKKIIDVMNTVVKLRKDRDRMVQAEDQYLFLYKCIYVYARNELQLNKLTESSKSTKYQAFDGVALTPLSFFQKDPFSNNFSRKSSITAA